MLLFKDLLPLPDPAADPEPHPDFLDAAPKYGAATAARSFARALGNPAESQRWFGRPRTACGPVAARRQAG